MEHFVKLQQSLDALFGTGSSKYLPKDIDIILSRKTGRIRTVSHMGKLLFTLRINGSLAISIEFAHILLQSKTFRENCIEISKDASSFVLEGRSVFCKHVVWCGKNVRIGTDTPILFENQVIAVGKAILSSEMISDFNRGVAIKVRDSLKSRKGKIVV